MAKKRKFTIKIKGSGEYIRDIQPKSKLQDVVYNFFTNKEMAQIKEKSIIEALHDYLINDPSNPRIYEINSGFKFDHFDYLGNDVDPDDYDPIN